MILFLRFCLNFEDSAEVDVDDSEDSTDVDVLEILFVVLGLAPN